MRMEKRSKYHPSGTPLNNSIRFINFITCSVHSSSFFVFSYTANPCYLIDCVYVDCAFSKMFNKLAAGSLELLSCTLSIENEACDFTSCVLKDCTFIANPKIRSHQYHDSSVCWESTFIVEHTHNNLKPFAYFFPLFSILYLLAYWIITSFAFHENYTNINQFEKITVFSENYIRNDL